MNKCCSSMPDVHTERAVLYGDRGMKSIHILLVGEGDLTFSFSLVRKLTRSKLIGRLAHSPRDTLHARRTVSVPGLLGLCPFSLCHVVATTLDTPGQVERKYPRAVPILKYFSAKQRIDVRHFGGIDATRVVDTLRRAGYDGTLNFDLIIFNNPHVGYEDMYRQWALLGHFFASTCSGLNSGLPTSPVSAARQVVVALSDDQPRRWGLLRAARVSGYCCVAAIPVLSLEFPEYDPRRHQRNSTFRSHSIVQYYFVPYISCMTMVKELQTVFAAYSTIFKDEGKGKVQHVDSSIWDETYQQLASQLAGRSDGEVQGVRTSPQALTPTTITLSDRMWDDLSTSLPHNASWFTLPKDTDFTYCVPLLHPHLAFHSGLAPWEAVRDEVNYSMLHLSLEERYSPQVPVHFLPELYRRQLHHILESDVKCCRRKSSPSCGGVTDVHHTTLPPHLDPAHLGRALTAKEQAKVARYHARFCGHEVGGRCNRAPPHSSITPVHSCSLCTPCRMFSAMCDFEQHMKSKHGGVDVLHPNMHARGHLQVVRHTTPSAACATSTSDNTSCSVDTAANLSRGVEDVHYLCDICELVFQDADAFKEHLQCLTPNNIAASAFVCEQCSPTSQFVDERALAQHTACMHGLPPSSAH